MIIIDIVLLILLFTIGGIATFSDITNGIIRNRWIAIFGIIGIVMDVFYYIFMANDIGTLFLLNFCSTTILSLILYFTHSIAGGDCKLIIIMSMLYPAGMYFVYGNFEVTLFISVCFSIVYGYLYLIVNSLWKIVAGKNKVTKKYIGKFIKGYFKAYCIAFLYVTLVNLIFNAFVKMGLFRKPSWMIWIFCVIVAWMSNNIPALRNRVLIIFVGVFDVFLAILIGVLPFSLNLLTYVFTAALMLCQMMIRTNLYENVSTANVRRGMILSTFSSISMQNSKVKGLPNISCEDLRSRLTEEEAESVRRWGKTPEGMQEVSIVKKIPFAVFITLGYGSYLIIWSVLL